jgi:hypothetical protein
MPEKENQTELMFMESLAIMVFVIWCLLFLCGPMSLWFHHAKLPILAAITALAAIWLGIFWFAHVYTWARYLGLVSAGCGLYVVWRTAHRI